MISMHHHTQLFPSRCVITNFFPRLP
jgi:hypothetical protein